MYVLIYLVMNLSNGTFTTGTAEFRSKQACEAAGAAIQRMAKGLTDPTPRFSCVSKE